MSVYLAGKYEDTILMSALVVGLLWSSEPCKSLTVCKVIYKTPIISIGLTTKLYDTLHTKKLQPSKLFFFSRTSIHYFHIDHNLPNVYPPPPHPHPKSFLTTVFDFSWDNFNTQEYPGETMVQNLGGKQGAAWSMQKWRITRFIAC